MGKVIVTSLVLGISIVSAFAQKSVNPTENSRNYKQPHTAKASKEDATSLLYVAGSQNTINYKQASSKPATKGGATVEAGAEINYKNPQKNAGKSSSSAEMTPETSLNSEISVN